MENKKPLKRVMYKSDTSLYHFKNDIRINGKSEKMRGDCTFLRGDCTDLRGDYTDLIGDCTDLIGDCSNLRGVCTGLSGDLDKIIERPARLENYIEESEGEDNEIKI